MIPWFISPWDAARLSLAAQSAVALQFLRVASGQEPRRQEIFHDAGEAPSAEPPMRASPMATGRPKTVSVRKAMDSKTTASKVKDKKPRKPRRKNKIRRK